jgi:putative spermidine/putrescine transport system substrate-binding protein
MRSRRTTAGACVATLALLVAACGSDDKAATPTTAVAAPDTTAAAAPDTTAAINTAATAAAGGDTDALAVLGEGEGEVNLIAWAGYVEDGSTDPAVDWVTPFEDETGCKVNVKLGNTSDEMVQLMQTGEYDGVSASGDATTRLIEGGEVSAINTDLIPNYADVFDGLKLKPWNSKDGVPYGVPHGRGANLLVYNTEAFPEAPDSIGVMFEDSAAAGKISVYDSPIYIADAAIYLMATQPDLGITNPYALDQTQFDAAIAALQAQKDLAGQYWALYTDQQTELESGNVLAGTTWQVIVNLAEANGAKIAAVKQKEGATGWSDTWMISSKAKHPNCMYMWMNHIVSPVANAGVAEWFGEAPANAQACTLTSDGFCDTYHAADEDYWTDVWYWTTATETCLDGRTDVTCVPYSEWVNAWSELRA